MNKIKSITLLVISFILISLTTVSVYADDPAYSVTLNDYDISTKKFPNATGTDGGSYQSLVVMASTDNKGSITLPTITGYTRNDDLSTDYSHVINLSTAKTAKVIAEEYIRNIEFLNNGNKDMKISISLSSGLTNTKTFYFSANDHYYQYITFTGTPSDWITTYNTVKSLTYQGRQGYLATVTSLEEDLFIYIASNGAVGWLGGTTLDHGTLNGQHYDSFATSGTNNWYWACGPEIGQEFYSPNINKTSLDTGKTLHDIHQENYALNYHNWSYEGSGAPVGDYNGEPNGDGSEQCLTTLPFGYGFATKEKLPVNGVYPGSGGNENCYGTYSWNNIPYNCPGYPNVWVPKGYVVEYGNQTIGDSNTSDVSANYISTNATISLISINVPTPNTGLVYNGSTKTGVASGTGYTVTNGSAIEIGNYIAVATLEPGYIWTDGTLTDKNISWSILEPPTPTPPHNPDPGYVVPNTGIESVNNHSLLKLSSLSILAIGTYITIKKKKDN